MYGKTESLRSVGHPSVVGNEPVEFFTDLERGRKMECIERSERHRLE